MLPKVVTEVQCYQKWLQKYNITKSGYRSTMLPKVVTEVQYYQKWLQKCNVTKSGYISTMLPKVVTAVLLGTIMSCISVMLLHLSLGFLSSTWAQFHNNLIWLNFNPKYSSQNYTFFSQVYLGMLKDEYIVYLCMYLNISCIC